MLHNLLLLEHEAPKRVFRVPKSVQKRKTTKFHKPYGIIEQEKRIFLLDEKIFILKYEPDSS